MLNDMHLYLHSTLRTLSWRYMYLRDELGTKLGNIYHDEPGQLMHPVEEREAIITAHLCANLRQSSL